MVHVSRWLNGAAIRSSNPDILESLYTKSFIDSVQWKPADDSKYYPASPSTKRFEDPLSQSPDFDYGYSIEQIELIGFFPYLREAAVLIEYLDDSTCGYESR